MSPPHFGPYVPDVGQELRSFAHYLDESAHHFVGHDGGPKPFSPQCDIEEHPESYEIYANLPGADPSAVEIEPLDDYRIQIKGTTSHLPKRRFEAASSANRESDALTSQGRDADADASIKVHNETSRPGLGLEENVSVNSENRGEEPNQSLHLNGSFKSKVDIEASQDTHTETKTPTREDPGTKIQHILSERVYGDFYRVFTFPHLIHLEGITANLEESILHLKILRKVLPLPKRVEIITPPYLGPF